MENFIEFSGFNKKHTGYPICTCHSMSVECAAEIREELVNGNSEFAYDYFINEHNIEVVFVSVTAMMEFIARYSEFFIINLSRCEDYLEMLSEQYEKQLANLKLTIKQFKSVTSISQGISSGNFNVLKFKSF